jgi:hypothetical protein
MGMAAFNCSSDELIDFTVSRIRNLFSFCTNLAVKQLSSSRVVIGISLWCKTDFSPNRGDTQYHGCIEGADCQSVDLKAVTAQEATFSQLLANRASISKIMASAARHHNTCSSELTDRTVPFLQQLDFHVTCCHISCCSFFGGLVHVSAKQLFHSLANSDMSVWKLSLPAFGCVTYPYAAFMRLCYKHSYNRWCAEPANCHEQAVQDRLPVNNFNSSCIYNMQNCALPVHSPSEMESVQLSSRKGILPHPDCTQSGRPLAKAGCECLSPSTDSGYDEIIVDYANQQQEVNCGCWEEITVCQTSTDSCHETADLDAQTDGCGYNCCSEGENGLAVSCCVNNTTPDMDFTNNSIDICHLQSERTDLLLTEDGKADEIIGNGCSEFSNSDDECSYDRWEDDSDGECVEWIHESDSNDDFTAAAVNKLPKKSAGSAFFVRASDFDDSDSSSDSDSSNCSSRDAHVSCSEDSDDDDDDDDDDDKEEDDEDDDDDDDDDDWSTTREPADLSCLSDLDPFQINGLYIPPTSTTPITQPTTSCCLETARVESSETEATVKMKHVNDKWNRAYGNATAPKNLTVGRKKVCWVLDFRLSFSDIA